MDNIYESIELKSTDVYSTLSQLGPDAPHKGKSQGSQERFVRTTSLYKRAALAFACLWVITLITMLGVIKYQKHQDGHKSAHKCRSVSCPLEVVFPYDKNITVNQVFSALSRKRGNTFMSVWKWICEASADVTLDPNTAQANLILSGNGKQVRLGEEKQDFPNYAERYDPIINVLGKQGFTSGRHYWEVEVGEKTEWFIGVAKESVSRKGSVILNLENGYWTVELRNGTKLSANAASWDPLPLDLKPRTLGVYVDYEEGQVSFYNVETRNHIYTFTDTFTEKLYPFFCPGLNERGENSDPLIIPPRKRLKGCS
ncbi:E3 ubiquitin-protein ligase TRIM39-like isoform X1 [Lepisosteus oculatus]|uniref:E3 ubiquitin-protein ligase TRIM39-like isoform X1 n=1 Tax=Lepisosteus oculatus TaxID=7918 RepID=UPI003711A8F1